MRKIEKTKDADRKGLIQQKNKAYKTPKLVVHSGSEFVRKLGPAQACSPNPDFY